MNVVRNILVVIDPAVARPAAVDKASLLAEKFRATLQLFACGTRSRSLVRAANAFLETTDEPTTALNSLVEDLAAPLRARGMEVTTHAVCATSWRAVLLDYVKQAGADLIVKDTHHHTFTRRTVARAAPRRQATCHARIPL